MSAGKVLLSTLLRQAPEVQEGLTADRRGEVTEVVGGPREEAQRLARGLTVAIDALAEAGAEVGLGPLEELSVRGARKVRMAAVRPDALLLVALDASRDVTRAEQLLREWVAGSAGRGGRAEERRADASGPAPEPRPTAALPAVPPAAPASRPVPAPAPRPAAAAPTRRPAEPAGPPPDAWTALRRALARGRIARVAELRAELGGVSDAGRPGGEALEPAERDRALAALTEGIEAVTMGDCVAGLQSLAPVAAASQRNLSLRWTALQWSTWACLAGGALEEARAHAKEALELARQLDVDARAVSQWTAAELVALGGDMARAASWLSDARARFERMADSWGLGRAWLAEARIMAAARREPEALEAAGRARAADPGWDEPAAFLAQLAVMRDDLAEAERLAREVEGPAATRVLELVDAIRDGRVTQLEAGEFLRELASPPSAQTVRELERIAGDSPRFIQAREELGWVLLRLGKHADAGEAFRALLDEELSAAGRASVARGLERVARVDQPAEDLALPGAEGALAPQSWASGPPAPAPAWSSIGEPAGGGSASRPSWSSIESATGGNGSATTAFGGRLNVLALPDLLEFLRSARRTGLLVLSSQAGTATLRFRDGRITAASSPDAPKLGQILLRAEQVSSLALQIVTTRQAAGQTDQPIGELLVSEGLVEVEALKDALRTQIRLVVRDVIRWKEGEFNFNQEPAGGKARADTSVEVDAQVVLLELFKEADEASRGSAPEASRDPATEVEF